MTRSTVSSLLRDHRSVNQILAERLSGYGNTRLFAESCGLSPGYLRVLMACPSKRMGFGAADRIRRALGLPIIAVLRRDEPISSVIRDDLGLDQTP